MVDGAAALSQVTVVSRVNSAGWATREGQVVRLIQVTRSRRPGAIASSVASVRVPPNSHRERS